MSEAEQVVVEPTAEVAPQTIVQSGGWVDTDGKFLDGFRSKLPEGLGDHSFLDKFQSVPDLIKWGVNANKMIGKKAEEVWASDDPELVAKRQEIMGVPKSASEYEFDAPEFTEGMPVEQINARVAEFKDKAKELGLNKAQVKQLLEWDLGGAVENFNSSQDSQLNALREAEADLRKEWKGNKYEYNVAKVGEALDYLGLTEFKDNAAIANDPKIIKQLFEKIVPLIANDTLVESRQQENYASSEDRMRQIEDDMMSYTGRNTDAKYQAYMKERERLLENYKK